MFVIGTSEAIVHHNKLELPKEYRLKKNNRTIYGVWQGEKKLYLSDDVRVLKQKVRQDGMIFEASIDIGNHVKVPRSMDQAHATIRGCITTIEIDFKRA